MLRALVRRFVASVAHRTTKRYNVLKMHTLAPGYWDKDEIMLHAIMTLVVDFVEIECSFMELDIPYSFREKLWLRLPWFLRNDNLIRSRERGIKHIESLISMYEDGMKDSSGHPRIIRDAYLWWKDTRPQHLNKIEELNKKMVNVNSDSELQKLLVKIHKFETEVDKQDTKMLKKIVEARSFMWT